MPNATPDGGGGGGGGGFQGMDPAAVRAMAAKLTQGADQLQTLAHTLTSAVQGADWKGPDREAFLSAWQGQHMNAIKQVVTALNDASQKATKNASDQESTSSH